MKRHFRTLAALLMAVLMLFTACGTANDDAALGEPISLTVAIGQTPTTLDCAKSAEGSETILYHLYENLMRWEDNGDGYAVLAPGQAENYAVETDFAGNATYTFTLRDDIRWSDGEKVTAHHFAAAWKRLADPAANLPHRELMDMITGYDDVQETGDTDLLGVSAPDAQTFIVTLKGNPPYFLTTLCAGAYTMPIRHNPPSKTNIITNGPYTVAEFNDRQVSLNKSTTYYDAANTTVESITFIPATDSQTDYEKLVNGTVDLVRDLPNTVIQELTVSENWQCDPVTTTLALAFNTLATPLDSTNVRAALRLVIDEQAIVSALADGTYHVATGLVPCGVADYSTPEEQPEPADPVETLPDPNAPVNDVEEKTATYWDFRAHSEGIVTMETDSNYLNDCSYAKELFAEAGYRDGKGFPIVDYIFLNTEENVIIAKALQTMWREQLGVNVTLRALSQEDYDSMLTPVEDPETALITAPFQIAALELPAKYNDASSLLATWHSTSAENFTGYTSPGFDILLDAADAAVSSDAYDAYLHDAEAILLADAPVIPLCYRGTSFRLNEKLTGLYRAPNGIYFLSRITWDLKK